MSAPVALFVYNRPDHTAETLSALRANSGCSDTDLFIFSDAPKSAGQAPQVEEVRALCRQVAGFRSVTIVEREVNWGLAKSIVEGVTSVVERFGRVIVLEDDLVTSPAFLAFMNQALDQYEAESKVWHVSGWSYPIDHVGSDDAFLWRGMNCWGWATWADRWRYFEKDPAELVKAFNWRQRRDFDLGGTQVFWPQVTQNVKGRINTWAIFWYATIFRRGGLCLNPKVSFVTNIGHDGSGVHCGTSDIDQARSLNTKTGIRLPSSVTENGHAVSAIRSYYIAQRRPIWVRVINKLSRMLIKKNIVK